MESGPIVSKPTRTVFLAISAFAVCSLAVTLRSGHGFLEADGTMHYVMARHAIEEPLYLVDVWGRPLCTAIYAYPAKVAGLFGVRCTSLAIAIGVAIVAWRLAAGQGLRWPVLALILTLGEPLLFLHSFSELTELPFALLLGCALLAYQQGKFGIMAMLCALAPLSRPEGFVILLLAAFGLLVHKKWFWLLVLPAGLIVWSIAGHILAGPMQRPWWTWLHDHWPYESGSEYAAGSIFHFVGVLPVIVGPFVLPFLWVGLTRTKLWPAKDTVSRAAWLTAVLPMGVLIGHSLLYRLGKLSSSGEVRYLLIAAPMWGVLTARGWETIFTRFNWARPMSWAALAVVVPGLVNIDYRILPLKPTPSMNCAEQFVAWYRHKPEIREEYPHVLTNHPDVFFFLDVSPIKQPTVFAWSRDQVEHPASGTVLVWDSIFCEYNADEKYVAKLPIVAPAGWVEDYAAEIKSGVDEKLLGNDPWHIYLSPQDIHSRDTVPPATPKP